jgi:uncharacterized protein YlzI (FlbEa/FlbD family)
MADISDLAAVLNDHQVTDSDGVVQDTPVEESAPQEAVVDGAGDKVEDTPELVTTAEDDSGKKYVPEERFKEVYAKMKSLERAQQQSYVETPAEPETPSMPQYTDFNPNLSKQDMLETELLFTSMPEFDPNSSSYSKELDTLGAEIFRAHPEYTKTQAARKAKELAKNLSQRPQAMQSEARNVKASQSDSGITSRVQVRQSQEVDPDKMSLQEKEQYLKEQGLW